MTINLALVYIHINSRHSNLSFAYHFFYLLIVPKMARIRINTHQESHQRETIRNKIVFFPKLVRQKSQ